MPTTNIVRSQLITQPHVQRFDVLGPILEFLSELTGSAGRDWMVRGTIPPGVVVPLHSHADFETFIMVSGQLEGLSQTRDGYEWLAMGAGDVLHIPGGAKHAFRNRSSAQAVTIMVTTETLGRFLKEIGRPVVAGAPAAPPPPEAIAHFLRTADQYGYWIGSPEENAEIGLVLPAA